jgi:two-component system response regulator TctD
VDCLHDGVDADAALATQNYDLIILDISLPNLTGLELLRRFRQRRGLGSHRESSV